MNDLERQLYGALERYDAKRKQTMTTKQADKAIKSQKTLTVRNNHFDETFKMQIVSRDRYLVYSKEGGVFERDELEIISEE